MPRLRPNRIVILALFLAIPGIAVLGSCASAAANAPSAPPPISTPAPTTCLNADTNSAYLELRAFDTSVFCLINQRRAENGLKPLRNNGLLRDAAAIYATSQLSGQFYGHDGCLNGKNNCSTPSGRLKFLNYITPKYAWIVGEVLRGAHPETATPNLVVQAWLDSPIHRVEVLKGKYREMGVSSVRGITDNFPQIEGVTTATEFGFRKLKKKFRKKSRR